MKYGLSVLAVFLFTSDVLGLEEDKLHTYLKLLKVGCSVEANTELDITADGRLIILKKTKVAGASFELKSSETQNILNALKDDKLKGDQASEQRKCQQHYLDKIFKTLLPSNGKVAKKDLSKASDGYLFELKRCKKIERNSIDCEFSLTSSFYDREIRLTPQMYDNFGNQYSSSYISIANFNNKGRYLKASLIADVETIANIKFSNVNTRATGISKLTVIDGVEFRDLAILNK